MKKSIILLLLVLYGFSSSGLSVYVHYCCGKIDKINFSAKHKSKCPAGADHAFKKSCCESKEFNNHIKDSYVPEAAANSVAKQLLACAEITPVFNEQFVPYSTVSCLNGSNSSPPFDKGSSLLALYCIFRI
jgi:hypothetical protein